ncbi:GNAT family N-acetyltransferase [candidate division KSB1 bacterium]|nr:GNAT family N-acetyltransferase [candidate division KSB1 bacterium]
MTILIASPEDKDALVHLIAQFRVTLAGLRGMARAMDLDAARQELANYVSRNNPIFVAKSADSTIVGYLVCRVDQAVVWAESLFVSPECRRRKIGSALYVKAEELAQELGGDSPYNWIHPNNDAIISFLQKRGYNVLNLIELRRPRQGETELQNIKVGRHEFDY